MANYLWKVTAIRNNGKVLKGMSVEILKSGTNAKPSQKEIAKALTTKFGQEFHDSQCGNTNFSFEQIK